MALSFPALTAHRLSSELPLEMLFAKTQISFRKKLKIYCFNLFDVYDPRWFPIGPDDKRKRFCD